MTRGEVWWANLPAPAGHRPVLLLSRDSALSHRSFIIVAPISRRVRHIPAEVGLRQEDGLAYACAVNLDVLYTISISSLQEYIATLSAAKLQAVEAAIHFALGLES
jgi:mRNA interferase MazF